MNDKQQQVFDNVNRLCKEIEKAMSVTIEPTNPEEIKSALENLRPYLANCSTMTAQSSGLYAMMKGELVEDIMLNEKVLNLKSDLQRKWIEGKLAKFSSLYERTISVEKNLRSSIEALRSQLSYEKETVKL